MPGKAEKAGGSDLGDRIGNAVLRALIGFHLALPYALRVRLMGWLLRRVIGPLAGYRRRARENLARIHPDWPKARRQRIADEVLDNFGRTLIENYSGRDLSARLAGVELQGEGLAALEAAKAAGTPVIFVTGHFGNHEVPRRVLTARGHVIGGLYRAMSNQYFNAHYIRTMEGVSGPVYEQGRGTAGFVRHLRGGGMATLLFDVHDSNGMAVDFLGEPAMTSTSVADLALRYKAVVIPYFGIRRADGLTFDVVVEAPITPADPVSMMREMTARLEARIKAHPGQWFWVHRRWKPGRAADQRSSAAARIAPGPGS